jgi:hypothetical protein
MNVHTMTVGFVVKPFSFKDVSVDVPELSMAACFVETPVALVFGSILPNLLTVSMFHISEPLSCVSCSILEMNLAPVLELCLIDIVHVHASASIIWILVVEAVAATVAHIVLMLRVHF